MKPITREMIKIYNIKKLGYDFMGYKINRMESLSFHHLIIPKRECPKKGYGDGYFLWNGAILRQDTSHDYLHLIENIDREMFIAITKEMIEENRQGQITIENLKRIREILLSFESQYSDITNKKGKKLIKYKYKNERIDL